MQVVERRALALDATVLQQMFYSNLADRSSLSAQSARAVVLHEGLWKTWFVRALMMICI